jgi:hypothetical protein
VDNRIGLFFNNENLHTFLLCSLNTLARPFAIVNGQLAFSLRRGAIFPFPVD